MLDCDSFAFCGLVGCLGLFGVAEFCFRCLLLGLLVWFRRIAGASFGGFVAICVWPVGCGVFA